MGSSRLPGKSTMPLSDIPLISYCIKRLKDNRSGTPIFLLTTTKKEDDCLQEIALKEDIQCFRGSENNLIDRYYQAAKHFNVENIIRATGDCPFINGELLDYCHQQIDYTQTNTIHTTKGIFPVGLDLEFFSFSALERIQLATNMSDDDKEHLTLHFYHNDLYSIKKLTFWPYEFDKSIHYTVDERDDYLTAHKIAQNFKDINYPIRDLLNFRQDFKHA